MFGVKFAEIPLLTHSGIRLIVVGLFADNFGCCLSQQWIAALLSATEKSVIHVFQ